ncbi:MAG: hypothetical protein Rsou_0200 [Candidatus Ruthia sp. Asou_11_S2]|nr:hypothetical protein [Candidatus Ruthia sp. Asou_11_S2]
MRVIPLYQKNMCYFFDKAFDLLTYIKVLLKALSRIMFQ